MRAVNQRGCVTATAAERAYLDHNATTPLEASARQAMIGALGLGNPSSIHEEGRRARAAVEAARAHVATLLARPVENTVFTSGATEALALALQPDGPDAYLLIGVTEHLAVLDGHGFARQRCEVLPVDAAGRLRLDQLDAALCRTGERAVVAVQSANNETGVIQPIAEIAERVHRAGGRLVCDAVQSAGKVDLETATHEADLVVISAHKFGGPKGVGALAWRGATMAPAPLLRGGGQERGFRAGTEQVAGIVGASAAAQAVPTRVGAMERIACLRDTFEAELRRFAPDAIVFGAGAPRLPNTSAFAIPGLDAQIALMALDLAGVAASSGSACTSGKVRPSHVLAAMGVDPTLARGALRVSLGPETVAADIERALETLHALLQRARPRAVAA